VGGTAMTFKRAVAKLRAQDWSAILIELMIVIVGVYIGMWVANRNQESVERQDTIRLLNQLRPEIRYQVEQAALLKRYMDTTGRYAKIAFAGWAGDPKISDNDFVIAAYEASQATGVSTNTTSWSGMFGANQVQNIRDPVLRSRLVRVLSLDAGVLDYRQAQTAYRQHVRETIPAHVQDAIRAKCDDYLAEGTFGIPYLTPTCSLQLPSADAATTAAALRARPSLVQDLNWHRATIAAMLYNFNAYSRTLEALDDAIVRTRDAEPADNASLVANEQERR